MNADPKAVSIANLPADPTLATLQKLHDDKAWEHTQTDVPVFMEHELWEVPHAWEKDRTVRIAVLPHDAKPKSGRMLYSIGAPELEAAAAKVNANLENHGKAVKLFLGHSTNGKPQKEQPDIVGYGVGARTGRFGPKGTLGVLLRQCRYLPGMWNEAKKYPERSPEFLPTTGELTGLALLKTDPKLPMGMMTYQQEDGSILYGADFMGEQDPTKQPDANNGLTPEEKSVFDKFAAYLEQTNPAFKALCAQHAAQTAAQPPPAPPALSVPPGAAPPAPPGAAAPPAAPATPPPAIHPPAAHPAPAKPPEKVNMESDVQTIQYAQLEKTVSTLSQTVTGLNEKLAIFEKTNEQTVAKYAQEASLRTLTQLVHEGFKIKDPKKELSKMAAMNDAQRVERANEIRENYARDEVAPIGPMVDIFEGEVGGEAPALTPQDVDQVVKYAEGHDIDAAEDWDKAVQSWAASKKPGAKAA